MQKISTLGVSPNYSLETNKRIRLVNSITLFTLCIIIISIALGVLLKVHSGVLFFFSIAFIFNIFPLIFNAKEKHIVARLFFLINAYMLIGALPILFGRELHYQYFLINGVGMPLLFFNNEIGWKKWILSFIAIPIWAFLEWYTLHNNPVFDLSTNLIQILRTTNDLYIICTACFLFYVFTSQSQKHIKTIELQKEKYMALNQELEQLSYIVSHDLKAPLKAISSVGQMIEMEFSDKMDNELKEMFGFMTNRASQLEQQIKAILTYSREGKINTELVETSTRKILSEVGDQLTVPESFTLNLPTKSYALKTSEIQLFQVLINLIGNAIKYHHLSNGTVSVTIKDLSKQLLFSITDNGPGIDEKHHAKIFGLFETAHGENREDSTGIGLAIVKKLVLQNGGNIGIESKLGEGSTFWFTWDTNLD